MKNNNKLKILIEIIAIILLISADQIVKFLTVIFLKGQKPFVILEGIFQLTYVENRGAAFGMLQNQRLFFLIFTTAVILWILFYFLKIPQTKNYYPLRITIIVFLSGAIGNLIDRIRLTYVIDTFYFSLIDFPVFNVADIYVVVSSFVFVYLIMFYYNEEKLNLAFKKTISNTDKPK